MQMWNVMKKFLLVSVVLFVALSVSAQDFPYAKMLTMTPKELKEKKFKYDENRNQWVLKKSNGWQTASIVLSERGNGGYTSRQRRLYGCHSKGGRRRSLN